MSSKKIKNFLALLFVFDCTVLPVIKIAGVSFKISYLIGFIYAIFGFVSIKGFGKCESCYETKKIKRNIFAYIGIVCFAELLTALYAGGRTFDSLIKITLGCILMIGSLNFGYNIRIHKSDFLFYCLIANTVINMILSLLGRAAPSILLRIYSISVGTFTDGYYRNGGIIGNPNATLLIMNVLFLAIVVFYSKGLLNLQSWKIVLLIVMPILCDIVVSSRGELIQTLLIEAYFVWCIWKNKPNLTSLVKGLLIALVCSVAFIYIVNNFLISKYSNVQLSLSRLTEIEGMANTSNNGVLDSILRPFYKFDVFSKRFVISPIWGSGFEAYPTIYSLEKGTTGYHNDIFLILASGGIVGLLLWLKNWRIATITCGIIILSPIITSGLSNTFFQSWAGTMMYFYIIGYVLSCQYNDL